MQLELRLKVSKKIFLDQNFVNINIDVD